MSSSSDNNFYSNLPVVEDFFNVSDEDHYHALPDDWYVAVTDIINSTSAIDDEQYKQVNILGASPIVGILNIAGQNELPYTFGGDGSSFCLPPELYDEAHKVLSSSRQIGKSAYNLDLRAAIIPVSYIRKQGYDIRVARYRASQHYVQAIFTGGGMSYAEDILKQEGLDEYHIPPLQNSDLADFSGLECRWQEVQHSKNEIITLLIKDNPVLDQPEEIYTQVLNKMRNIFGFDSKTNPIEESELTMNLSFSKLMGEAKFRTSDQGWLACITYILKVQLQTIIGKVLMALDYKTSATDWSLYKPDMVRNSDHRKFDDMLRVVISGSKSQRKEFEAFLNKQFEDGKLAYGMHLTDAAMITCMVFQYHRDHVHFVDGSGGGYVSAAKELKKRLHTLQQNS